MTKNSAWTAQPAAHMQNSGGWQCEARQYGKTTRVSAWQEDGISYARDSSETSTLPFRQRDPVSQHEPLKSCDYCNKPRDSRFASPLIVCFECKIRVTHPQCIPWRHNKDGTKAKNFSRWRCRECERTNRDMNHTQEAAEPSSIIGKAQMLQIEERIDFSKIEFPQSPTNTDSGREFRHSSWIPPEQRPKVVEPSLRIAFEEGHDDEEPAVWTEVTAEPRIRQVTDLDARQNTSNHQEIQGDFGTISKKELIHKLSAHHRADMLSEKRKRDEMEGKFRDHNEETRRLLRANESLEIQLRKIQRQVLSVGNEKKQLQTADMASRATIKGLRTELEDVKLELDNNVKLKRILVEQERVLSDRLKTQLEVSQNAETHLRSDKAALQETVDKSKSRIVKLKSRVTTLNDELTARDRRIAEVERHAIIKEAVSLRALFMLFKIRSIPSLGDQLSASHSRNNERRSKYFEQKLEEFSRKHPDLDMMSDDFLFPELDIAADSASSNHEQDRALTEPPALPAQTVGETAFESEGAAHQTQDPPLPTVINKRPRKEPLSFPRKSAPSYVSGLVPGLSDVVSGDENEGNDGRDIRNKRRRITGINQVDHEDRRVLKSTPSHPRFPLSRELTPEVHEDNRSFQSIQEGWDEITSSTGIDADLKHTGYENNRTDHISIESDDESHDALITADLTEYNEVFDYFSNVDVRGEAAKANIEVAVNRGLGPEPPFSVNKKALNEFNDAFGISGQAEPVVVGPKRELAFNTRSDDDGRSGRDANRKPAHSTFRVGRDIDNTLTG